MAGELLTNDLRAQIERGQVIAIVGAGVSIGATNRNRLASWTGLLEDGVDRCCEIVKPLPAGWRERVLAEIYSGDLDDLLSAAEKVSRKLGARSGGEYCRWLRETVGLLKAQRPGVIEALHGLGVRFATTNYDGLIEDVTGLQPVTWTEGAKVERLIRGDDKGVLHLHGYWDKPESVVLGIRSYEEVMGNVHAQNVLHALQTMKTLLFVGCGAGLKDPNFGSLLRWTGTVFSQSEYRRFRLAKESELNTLQAEHPGEQRLCVLSFGSDHAELEPFLRSLTPPAGAAVPGPVCAAVDPKFDFDAYQEAVCKRYRHLRLETLSADQTHYQDIELQSVFISQDVRNCQQWLPEALQGPKELTHPNSESVEVLQLREFRQHEEFRRQPLQNVLEVLRDAEQRLCVILGDPGAGKSSLAMVELLEWATSHSALDHSLPVFIELRHYHRNCEGKDFLQYLEQSNDLLFCFPTTFLRARLEEGTASILFDGLDEVFDSDDREQVANQIAQLAGKFKKARLVVTSRLIGYPRRILRDAGFQHWLLQDFDDSKVERFLGNWCSVAVREESNRQRVHERINMAVQVTAIRELAGNPLLLTMMAMLARQSDLPRDQFTLYQRCSELLLELWDTEKALVSRIIRLGENIIIDTKDKQTILRRLAWRMQNDLAGRRGNLVARSTLEEIMHEALTRIVDEGSRREVTKLVINQLRERNFILCHLGGEFYAFVHRGFLEYFCAEEIRNLVARQPSVAVEGLKVIFGRHWREDAWREVLVLTANALEPTVADEVLAPLVDSETDTELRPLWLGYMVLTRARDPLGLAKTMRAVRGKLEEIVRSGTDDLSRDNAVSRLANFWRDDATRELLTGVAQNNVDSLAGGQAVASLAEHWKDDTTRQLLTSLAQHEPNSWAGDRAVTSLAEYWKDDTTRQLLISLAQNNAASQAGGRAVASLAEHWKDDTIRQLLTSLAQHEPNSWAGGQAVASLAEHWKDDTTHQLLIGVAQNNADSQAGDRAVASLAKHWKDDTTHQLLISLAQTKTDSWAGRQAVASLGEHWKDDTTHQLLTSLAQNNADSWAGGQAVAYLAKHWKDDTTRQLLISLAQNNADSWAGGQAVAYLAKHWKDDTTRQLLTSLTQNNATSQAGRRAVQFLAKHWKDDTSHQLLTSLTQNNATSQAGGQARSLLLALGLTAREAEVLYWITEGKTNPEISIILDTSPATVKKHAANLYAKLGVPTRTSAARCALSVLLANP
jgi:DNA-binding CsgD family transcriptional regulator